MAIDSFRCGKCKKSNLFSKLSNVNSLYDSKTDLFDILSYAKYFSFTDMLYNNGTLRLLGTKKY